MTETLAIDGIGISVAASGRLEDKRGYWIAPEGDVTIHHPFGAGKFYRHGWHSWALTHWADMAKPPERVAEKRRMYQVDDIANAEGNAHRGSWVGAVEGPDGNAVVVGSLGFDAHVTADASALGGVCNGEPVQWFIGYGNAEATLELYASVLAERTGNVRQSPGHVWCSWYSFYEDITEADMKAVLEGIEGSAFEVVQLDDGWQQGIGDWEANDDFPSGMAALASAILDAGYRPGIWIAPFIVHERSRTFVEHPEWLVKAPNGEPALAGYNWDGPYYALDLTHPGARDRVEAVISNATEWGFTYLKLDFLFAAAIPGGRHDNSLGRETVFRSGVELIRQTAGDDVYLLGCGPLIIPSIGVFNGIRVGQDVAPYWENRSGELNDYAAPSTRYAVSNSHSRLWLDPVVAVDPDVVYFRSHENEMTPHQMQMLQDIAVVCDFVATSDPPSWLEPDEREVMDAYLRARPTVGRIDRYRFKLDDRVVDFREASLDA